MYKIRQILLAASHRFMGWYRKPHVIAAFLLGGVMCMMLTDKVISFSYRYDTLLQMGEVYVWTFADGFSILLSAFLLFVLFSDMPFAGQPEVPYQVYRLGRKVWLAGQIIYVAGAVFIYDLFIMLCTVVFSAGRSFPGNSWSETAALLGYSGIGEKLNLSTSVKVLEQTTPYKAAAVIFLLVFLYIFWIATLIFVFNLKNRYRTGLIAVLAVNLYGIILNADKIQKFLHISDDMKYKANIIFGWISPLNHACYTMHSFGYDYLPKIWVSICLFLILTGINIAVLYRTVMKYDFSFVQRKD